MTINIQKSEGKTVVEIIGRLDTTTAPEFSSIIEEKVDAADELVIDMNKLEYISSAGLRVLLCAQKKMQKSGSMKLIGVCEAVMEVLEMTGFADILVIE